MEPKKNPKTDLENYRGIFLQAGLVFALVVSIVAIEWKTYEKKASDLGEVEAKVDDKVVPITQRKLKKPPPPPPPPEQIEVVEDEVELDEELDIQTTETDQMEEVENIEMEEETTDEVLSFAVIESVPVFPGCEDADDKGKCFENKILRYVQSNFEFPQVAKEMGIGGRIYVNFVIEKDGTITNVQIARGVDKILDKEAKRVVKSIPKMAEPAKQRGNAVRLGYTLPINAKIQ